MKRGRSIWKIGWRVALSAVLLGWIFHAIFLAEARRLGPARGYIWEQLSRAEQWSLAWSHGPGELWRTLNLVQPGALLLSLVFMGMTIVLGLVRWRLVLGAQGLESFAAANGGDLFRRSLFQLVFVGVNRRRSLEGLLRGPRDAS